MGVLKGYVIAIAASTTAVAELLKLIWCQSMFHSKFGIRV